MKYLTTAILFFGLLCLGAPAMSRVARASPEQDAPLKLSLQEIPGADYSATNIPLKVVFENTGKNPVRLLNIFDRPGNLMPLFFSVMMNKSDGNIFLYSGGGGKVAFRRDSITYITLARDEKYEVTINLIDWMKYADPIKDDTYKITLQYHNQYGQDCFKGYLTADTPLYLNLRLGEQGKLGAPPTENAPLKLSLSEIPDAQYSATNVPVKVTFENVSKNPLRLFNVFDRTELLPCFLHLEINRSDGNQLPSENRQCKVDFVYNSMKYITLAAGEKYSFTINLKDWFGPDKPIPNDTYKITLAYHNQYGTDCFKVKPWLASDAPLYLRLWFDDK